MIAASIVLAYFIVGITLVTLFRCAGLPSMPGDAPSSWDAFTKAFMIFAWPIVLGTWAICWVAKLPSYISDYLYNKFCPRSK